MTTQTNIQRAMAYGLVVRWPNGELEGFEGFALCGETPAERDAKEQARRAAHAKRIDNYDILDPDEWDRLPKPAKDQIKKDWKLSRTLRY